MQKAAAAVFRPSGKLPRTGGKVFRTGTEVPYRGIKVPWYTAQVLRAAGTASVTWSAASIRFHAARGYHIPGKIDKALSAHANYVADNSTLRRVTKDRTMKEALDVTREFANPNIRCNKKMAAEYKIVFGIHEADREPTPGGEPPTRAAVTDLKPLAGRRAFCWRC
jgi:hypothetical protein